MHFLTFVPCALVAAASLAAAYPVDTDMFTARADSDAVLMARDIEVISLLAREYVAATLAARVDRPRREQFRTHEDFEKAWLAWNRTNRKIDHAEQAISKKYNAGPQPQREQFSSHAEAEKAWLEWNKMSRKESHASIAMLKKHTAQGEKEQKRLRQDASGEKKPKIVSKILGGKSKRELLSEWEELE
ncbi:hypothetical protein FOMPIDRAFT_1024752 [Fomitopsis schrenkii]|uniref:Uncharacterized protein n=1 Tax=Fomitopsis schrenkii TaxID=2126942 RepID=S8E4D1_FOMSC|nr:hypothetical protein FOMPIDRAFT_1024752 [Fomitopsis schrenkii]